MACKHWPGDARDAPPGAFSPDGLSPVFPVSSFPAQHPRPRSQIATTYTIQGDHRASSRHPEVLLPSRGRFPEGPRSAPLRVYSVRRRLSAPAHSTQRKPGLAMYVVCLPGAISAFQRHEEVRTVLPGRVQWLHLQHLQSGSSFPPCGARSAAIGSSPPEPGAITRKSA
jgi:hypothetical protein